MDVFSYLFNSLFRLFVSFFHIIARDSQELHSVT